MSVLKNKAQFAVLALFLALTLLGLCTVNDYTGSYDELVQQGQLHVSLKEYALLFEKLGIRWETALTLNVPGIDEFVNRDYGMASMYLCAPFLGQMLSSQAFTSFVWGTVTWMWFMAGVWSLYAIARQLGAGRGIACFSAMLLYLSPVFFSHAHYNDKDIILLALMLVCLWQGLRFLQKMTLSRGMLFALCGALAANLRIVGLLPVGLIGLGAIIKLTLNREWKAKFFLLAAEVIAFFGLFYFVLTPAVWSDPIGFFEYLLSNTAAFSRWSGTLFFRDASFQLPENPLPFYYIPYMMLVTLPLYVFPLAAVGQCHALYQLVRSKGRFLAESKGIALAAATCWWVLPIAAYVVVRPLVYNSWRHFYFVYAGVAVIAGYGAHVLWTACRSRKSMQALCAAFLSLCLGVTAVGMAVNHPRQSSYYNVLAGQKLMETDYWNSSGTYALKKLMKCPDRNQELPLEVGCWFMDIQNARFKMSEEEKAVLTTTVEKDAPYLYYIENYVQVYNVPDPEGYHVLFEVESYGRLIGTMYERDQ